MTRREFLRLAGGVVVVFSLTPPAEAGKGGAGSAEATEELDAWLRVGADGRAAVFVPTPEAGQGIRTSLAQMVAEELTIPISSVDMVMGDTQLVPSLPEARSRPALATVGRRVRAAAAQVREVLAEIAASRWGVPREKVEIRGGRALMVGGPWTAIPLGDLARGRRLMRKLEMNAPLRPAGEYESVGKPLPRQEGRALVTGEAQFVADMRLPGMVYGKVFRPPCLGARLVEADTRGASGQPGVIAVVRQGDFIGVVATSPESAERGARRIEATWEEGPHPSMSSLYEDLREGARLDTIVQEQGEVERALASARYGFAASYRTPFLAHAPIEPHGALAVPEENGILVYASTQQPFAHRAAVAEALGLPAERVHVICAPVGGAFGGKDTAEVSVEAARLARVVGRPVMVTYSREEEFALNYFGPAALIEVRCGVSEGGEISAWDCQAYNCGPRGAAPPYEFASLRARSYRCQSPLPQGHWRGEGGPANAFAREVHLDHVASELGCDAVELRLRHLASKPRLAAVVEAAAERWGWGSRRAPTGLGVGFACAEDSGGCVAQIAEVEVERRSGEVRVRRVLTVFDAGLVVNPDGLRNQIEGAVVMGLGFTLREAIRYEQGRILATRFASYPIPTFRDTPQMETILISDPDDPPGGGGTPAICPIAAAVANAVFDAVGVRIRELPLSGERVRSALRQSA